MPGTYRPEDRHRDPDQLDLFAEPRPDPDRQKTTTGRTHPETSRQAAERALPRSGTQRRRVLDLLRGIYPDGLTNEEIRDRLRIPYGSTLARRNELLNDGWVEDSGDRRDTESGSPAIVWVYVPKPWPEGTDDHPGQYKGNDATARSEI